MRLAERPPRNSRGWGISMTARWKGLGFVATAALLSGWVDVASAQQVDPGARPFTVRPAPRGTPEEKQPLVRGDTVASRPRPEYDPLGVRAGSFLIFPQLSVFQGYNDNVFATENNEKDDFFLNLIPALSVQSDWNRHAVNFSSGASYTKYYEYTRQDYTDWFVNGNGRIDITRDAALFLGGGFAEQHELPGSPDFDTDAREPTRYNVSNGFARYVQQFGKFRTSLDGAIDYFNYKNGTAVDGDSIDNDDDDRLVYGGGPRIGYELFPNYEVFVRAAGNRREYDDTDGTPTPDRSSSGYSAVTGLSLDLGGIVFGEIYIGYLQQFYDSNDFDTVEGVDGGLALTWNVTPLTTVTGRVARQVNDTTQTNASGIFTTQTALDVDHELLRNLILNANFAYVNDDYDGIDRTDNFYVGGIGARYLFTRNFNASLGYRFIQRNSSGDDDVNDYTRNLVRIGVQAQM